MFVIGSLPSPWFQLHGAYDDGGKGVVQKAADSHSSVRHLYHLYSTYSSSLLPICIYECMYVCVCACVCCVLIFSSSSLCGTGIGLFFWGGGGSLRISYFCGVVYIPTYMYSPILDIEKK
ncbi:hypothetical protein V8C37DRAFT_367109 [Trichoderma ceciliae]